MVIPMNISKRKRKKKIQEQNLRDFYPGTYCQPQQSRDDTEGGTLEKANSGEIEGC